MMKWSTHVWWVTLLIVCSGFGAGAQEQDPDAWYFMQITDPHFGCGPSVESTIAVVEAIRTSDLQFDFVALTGDVLCDDVPEHVAQPGFEALRQLAVPVYILAGNHDYVGANLPLYRRYIGAQPVDALSQGHDLNYAVVWHELLLLFVSSIQAEHNPEDEALAWARATLTAYPERPILLFHHEPFLPVNYAPASLQRWRAFLAEFPIAAAFAGHLHRDALLWHDDVPEFVASCLLPWDGRQPSYRLYEYKSGRVSYQTFYVTMPNQ